MTPPSNPQPSNPEPSSPGSSPPPRRRRMRRRIWLGLGASVLVGSTVGVLWVLEFVRNDLVPLLDKNLTDTLNRPISFGPVQGFTVNSLTLGRSRLPPTATDKDTVTIEQVVVRFNPLEVLFSRRLGLDITLVRPEAFLDENAQAQWIETKLDQDDRQPGFIKTELEFLRVQDGRATLVPSPERRRRALVTAANGPLSPQVKLLNIDAAVSFHDDNQRIEFEASTNPETGGALQIAGETRPQRGDTRLNIRAEKLATELLTNLVAIPITARRGQVFANMGLQFRSNQLDALSGTARVQDATAQVVGVPRPLQGIVSRLRFQGKQITLEDTRSTYGTVPAALAGTIHLDRGYNLTAQLRSVTLDALRQTFQINLPIAVVGAFNTDARITGPLNSPIVSALIGNSRRTRIDKVEFEEIRAQVRFQNQTLFFEDLVAEPVVGGSIQGSGQVALGDEPLIDIVAQLRGLPGDAIARLYNANLGQIRIGTVGGEVNISGAPDTAITQINWRAAGGSYPARGAIAIADNRFRFRDTVVQVAGGTVNGEGELFQGRWRALLRGAGVQLATFAPQFSGSLDGTVEASGRLDQPGVNAILATGRARARVAGGEILADADLSNGRWQVALQSTGVQLRQFSRQLTGSLDGTLRASGRLDALRAGAIAAAGQVNLSTVPVLNRPLTAAFRWTGDRLIVDRATARNFRANGSLIPQLEGRGAPTIRTFNFNVNASDIDLAALPVALPPQARIRGRAGFDGRVTGNLTTPQVIGQLRLDRFTVSDVAFDPLVGPVNFALGRGGTVNLSGRTDLTGQRDRIFVQLDGRYRPRQFEVRQAEVFASGRTVGDRLDATLQNFPLAILNLRPATQVGLGAVTGRLSGDVAVNLNTLAANGNVQIARPGIGYIQTEGCLTANFSYGSAGATLTNSELRIVGRDRLPIPAPNLCIALFDGTVTPSSRYRLTGSARLGSDPQFRGQLIADQGNLQDILTTLQWFDLSDLGRTETPTYSDPSILAVSPVGDPNTTLLNQLRRYAEINALLEQEAARRQEAERLPPLRDLQGEFTGTVDLATSQQTGVAIDFNLAGAEWRWGRTYRAEQVTAQGNLRNGILTLLPLRFQTGDAFVEVNGTLGGEQQSGQLIARNVPVDSLRNVLRLPVELDGDLDATATVSGSIGNPNVAGAITLDNARINRTPVQTASATFGYTNARLQFFSRLLVATETEPVTASGSIPYRFPFMTVSPDNDSISLTLNVKNEGLAVLSLFTDQVAWQGGNGAVAVTVSGTLTAPQIVGRAQLENASVSASALPEPLTNVNGNILFNGREVEVESLTGQFRQGTVAASGVLPVFGDPLQTGQIGQTGETAGGAKPLAIALNQVVLNFRGLYRGGVEGNVVVGGTALAPLISGQLTLSNGRVELPSGGGTTATAAATADDTGDGVFTPPQLSGLQVTLGDRLQVTLQPILNFVAFGDLTVNGPLAALRPRGVIRLRSGQVNLFTTQFNLARGFENTATFQPDLGLDPILNVRLATTVPEVTRFPTIRNTSLFPVNEIQEPLATDFGILNTVRIRAEVTGPASRLADNLSLTSNPPRSEEEIVSLLGGGFVDTLGRGDATLAIANLASSTLLIGVQNFISNTLGLADFRLYPTNVTSDEGDTTLGLAAELGVDVTNNLSVSVLQLLTVESPTQLNLRYRLTDQLTVRGFVDTNGGSGALVEFETRF